MSGSAAKKLRRAVYGDQSIRQPREYEQKHGTVRNIPLSARAQCQRAKRIYTKLLH